MSFVYILCIAWSHQTSYLIIDACSPWPFGNQAQPCLLLQVTGEKERALEGAAAASSPEPVPDVQQSCEEGEQAAQAAWRAECRALKRGGAASFSPPPSSEHPLESSPRLSSESEFGESPDRKINGARGRHFDPETGALPGGTYIPATRSLFTFDAVGQALLLCLSHEGKDAALCARQDYINHRDLSVVL